MCKRGKLSRDRSYIILGMSFMQQKQVIFNLEKKEVGFVRSNCSHDFNEMISYPLKRNITIPHAETGAEINSPLVIIAGIAAGTVMLVILIVCIRRRCRKDYCQVGTKATPETIVVQGGTVRSYGPVGEPASPVVPS